MGVLACACMQVEVTRTQTRVRVLCARVQVEVMHVQHQQLPPSWADWLRGMSIEAMPVQLHAMVMALFASVIAPFGACTSLGRHTWAGAQADPQKGRRTDGRTDRHTDQKIGRLTDRQAGRRTDRQTDRGALQCMPQISGSQMNMQGWATAISVLLGRLVCLEGWPNVRTHVLQRHVVTCVGRRGAQYSVCGAEAPIALSLVHRHSLCGPQRRPVFCVWCRGAHCSLSGA